MRSHLNGLRERANPDVATPLDRAGDGLIDAMLMIEAAIARASKPTDEPRKAGVDGKRVRGSTILR